MKSKGAGYMARVVPLLRSSKLKMSYLRRVAVDGMMSSREDYV